jgi:hypothetical protein
MARYRAETVGRLYRQTSARELNGPNSLKSFIYRGLYIWHGVEIEIVPVKSCRSAASAEAFSRVCASDPANFKYKLYLPELFVAGAVVN